MNAIVRRTAKKKGMIFVVQMPRKVCFNITLKIFSFNFTGKRFQ